MIDSRNQHRILASLTFGYFALLFYASLIPYDFRLDLDLSWHINQALHAWPVNPYARVSGSDVLSNLMLYIPLGALLATNIYLNRQSPRKAFATAFFTCVATSFSIEVIQLFSALRTASITDLIMNSVSGAAGAAGGALWGVKVWQDITSSINWRCKNNPVDILTLMFAGLLAADAMAPYLPTLLLSQVWHSVKASHFNPVTGFAQHPWHWWLVTHIMVYMALTLMVSQWQLRENSKAGFINAAVFCGLFATVTECGKLFIASRVMNTANIVANLCGILLAAILLSFWHHPLAGKTRLWLGIAGLSTYILYTGWEPFNFTCSPEALGARLPQGVEFLPFYHYAMGSSLNHVRLFVQTVIFSTALIYFVRLLFNHGRNNWFRILAALCISGGVGVLQEGGQLFLPSRTPSMTDIYCYMLGGFLATRIPLLYPRGEHSEGKT